MAAPPDKTVSAVTSCLMAKYGRWPARRKSRPRRDGGLVHGPTGWADRPG